MDEQYSKYTSELETFIRKNAPYFGCLQSAPSAELYIDHFRRREAKKGKYLLSISPANLYDSEFVSVHAQEIVYFSHFLGPDNVRKFCGIFQPDPNLHVFCSYGYIEGCGFVTNLEIFSSDSKKIIQFIDDNKSIEFKKEYNKSLGFGSFKSI